MKALNEQFAGIMIELDMLYNIRYPDFIFRKCYDNIGQIPYNTPIRENNET